MKRRKSLFCALKSLLFSAAILSGSPLLGEAVLGEDGSASPSRAPAADAGDEEREAALLFNTASRFYRQKNWRDAASTFGEFLKKFSRHRDAAEARFAAGYSLNRAGDHAAAVEVFRLAVKDEDSPWSADASFYLGRSL